MNPSVSPKCSDFAKQASLLTFFFGLAYFCQHFAQTQSALLSQPLTYYCKQLLGWGPKEMEIFLSVLIIPWTIKPVYGLVSDFIPLFGYRRKSYLLILNTVASLGFLVICGVSHLEIIRVALVLIAFSTAASDVLVDGLMVELGKKTGMTAKFQSQQWLWFNIAAVMTALAGGYLCEWFSPAPALRIASAITVLAPAVMLVATWFCVYEDRSRVNITELKETGRNLLLSLKSKTLWLVAAFLAFWQFSPSFGSPLYYHQTDILHFDQKFIGQLTAITCAGSVAGVLIYKRWFVDRFSTKKLMYISLVGGVISTLLYLFLVDPSTTGGATAAIIISVITGVTNVFAFLTTLTMAAEVCPKRVEALTFSVLMSVFNLSTRASILAGAYMFEDWFNNRIGPLILISAAFTFACFFILPFMPDLHGKSKEESEESN